VVLAHNACKVKPQINVEPEQHKTQATIDMACMRSLRAVGSQGKAVNAAAGVAS